MSHEIRLPTLVLKTDKSQFRFRCHAAAWSTKYGSTLKLSRRQNRDCAGLLLLSVTGPDTAIKSLRATLYEPVVEGAFELHGLEDSQQFVKARMTWGGRSATYRGAVAKVAPGLIHLVALADIAGLMPKLSDDHLWAELASPRYTTPLLRSWTPWLRQAMVASGDIVEAEGYASQAGVLKIEPENLDELVTSGVRAGHLRMAA